MLTDKQINDAPETAQVECPLCHTRREGRKKISTKGGKPVNYYYSAPLCQCAGANAARERSARLNRSIFG